MTPTTRRRFTLPAGAAAALRRGACIVALLPVQALPSAAQAPPAQEVAEAPEFDGSRRFIYAVVGAAVASIPAFFADDAVGDGGLCASRACMIGLGMSMGGAVGFLIGREQDRDAAREAAYGPAVDFRTTTVELEIMPEGLSARGGGVAVIGRSGVESLGPDGSMVSTAGAIRGVDAALALPARGAVLAGTSTGVYAFPLIDVDSGGRRVLEDAASSLEPVAAEEIVVAGGNLLRRLRLTGESAMLSLAEEARATLEAPASAVAYAPYDGVVWSLSGDRLAARSATALEEVGALVLPAPGRTLAVDARRAIITAGPAGAFVVSLDDPSSPSLLGRISGLGFLYDAVLAGSVAYVAAGPNGLLVFDVSDPAAPALLGSMRNLGFVSGVERGEGTKLYAIDRAGRRLLIIETTPSAGG